MGSSVETLGTLNNRTARKQYGHQSWVYVRVGIWKRSIGETVYDL